MIKDENKITDNTVENIEKSVYEILNEEELERQRAEEIEDIKEDNDIEYYYDEEMLDNAIDEVLGSSDDEDEEEIEDEDVIVIDNNDVKVNKDTLGKIIIGGAVGLALVGTCVGIAKLGKKIDTFLSTKVFTSSADATTEEATTEERFEVKFPEEVTEATTEEATTEEKKEEKKKKAKAKKEKTNNSTTTTAPAPAKSTNTSKPSTIDHTSKNGPAMIDDKDTKSDKIPNWMKEEEKQVDYYENNDQFQDEVIPQVEEDTPQGGSIDAEEYDLNEYYNQIATAIVEQQANAIIEEKAKIYVKRA